jgi:hypothetical protein
MALTNEDLPKGILEKFVTPSTINLYSDSTGRTLLHYNIVRYNGWYAKESILKILQKGADVMLESIDAGMKKLPVEIAVEYRKGKWTF